MSFRTQQGFMQSMPAKVVQVVIVGVTAFFALRFWILNAAIGSVRGWLGEVVGLQASQAVPLSWLAGLAVFLSFGALLGFVVGGWQPWRVLAMVAVAAGVAIGGAEYGNREAAQPHRLADEQVIARRHFNRQGEVLTYWSVTAGNLELFDREGHHPVTGVKLQPVNAEIILRGVREAQERIAQLKAAQERARQQAEEHARLAQEKAEAEERQARLLAEARAAQEAAEREEQRKRDEARQEAERRENERLRAVAEAEAKARQAEEDARRPPVMSTLFAAAGSCEGTPTRSVRGAGWYLCGRFLKPAARIYRGHMTIEGGRDFFGNMLSGSDGFTIPTGSTTFSGGPWSRLRPGTYTIRIFVDNSEIARTQLKVEL